MKKGDMNANEKSAHIIAVRSKKFGGETENRCKPPARIVAVFSPSFPIKEKDKKYKQLPHIKGVMLSSLSEKALA